MANFDLSALALKAVCPSNEILYDDQGMPSVMVKIPKMTYAELGLGDSTATFPAFIVNGTEVNEIYISKYQNIVMNGRAYSLPGQDPKTSINFDQALAACTAKGDGWHLMTAFEWGALIAWCEKNGFIPLGNNNYGKHSSESNYKALPATTDDTHYAVRTRTGTGPLTWYHDQTLDGIADLCGNVWEWTGGIRSVYGELQILVNNNAADSDHPQTAASAEWKAIKASDGTLITPDGSGTTSGSIKMDWVSSKLTYSASITDASRGEHNCNFSVITFASGVSDGAKNLLIALGMAPKTGSSISGHLCYFNNNEAERSFSRGGSCSLTAGGFASFNGNSARSYAYGSIGFRSAYIKLPAA
jgi:hypothetical protein